MGIEIRGMEDKVQLNCVNSVGNIGNKHSFILI